MQLGKERRRTKNKLAIVLPLGKERKMTKDNIGDSPALREREERTKDKLGDSPAFRKERKRTKEKLAIFLPSGIEKNDKTTNRRQSCPLGKRGVGPNEQFDQCVARRARE